MVLLSEFQKYRAGVQYAELSSFTSQLVQLDSARSTDNEVGLKAIAKGQPQILQCTQRVCRINEKLTTPTCSG